MLAYTWSSNENTAALTAETGNTVTTTDTDVQCVVTIVSRLDGSVCGKTDNTLSADKTATVSSFS